MGSYFLATELHELKRGLEQSRQGTGEDEPIATRLLVQEVDGLCPYYHHRHVNKNYILCCRV